MNFSEIQQTFNHGNILLTNGRFSVLYTKTNPDGSQQSFSNTINNGSCYSLSKYVLEMLIKYSDSVCLHVFRGGEARIDFNSNIFTTGIKYSAFPTSFKDKVNEFDIDDEKIYESNAFQKYVELRKEYDLDNEDEKWLLFAEFLSWVDDNTDQQEPPSGDSLLTWDSLIEITSSLYDELGAGEYEATEPLSEDMNGFIEIWFTTQTYLRIVFSGDIKNTLLNAIHQSSAIDFDIVNHEGEHDTYFTICFYP